MIDPGDLLVTGGPIVTLDDQEQRAEALLIRDGRIEVVGSLHTVRAASRGATVLDLAGATAIPGFVDAHSHIELSSVSLDYFVSAHTPPCESLVDVAAIIRQSHDQAPDYPWLVCRTSFGLHEKVSEGRLFHRGELDKIAPERPLAVFAGLHVAMLNTAGLRELGLLDHEPPLGSTLHRDPDGQPNGTVTEVFHLLPTWPAADVARALVHHHTDLLLAEGITTVSSIPFSVEEMRAVQELIGSGQLTTRFRHYPAVPWAHGPDDLPALRASAPDIEDRYQIPGIKVFVDGQGGDGLDHQFDDLKYSQDELDRLVALADGAGFQVIMHAVTTTGIRMAAHAILRADTARMRPSGGNPRRHRIEHGADYADTADIPLLRGSGALLVATPHFVQSESGPSTPPTALRTLLDAGVPIAGGTDTTGTVPEGSSPLYNMWCATALRPKPNGRDERLTQREALSLFSVWAADATPASADRGRLRPGMLGDLAILSENPLAVSVDRLRAINVDATVIAGEIVFSR
jgi:predicted amidohydrolase YtcJ